MQQAKQPLHLSNIQLYILIVGLNRVASAEGLTRQWLQLRSNRIISNWINHVVAFKRSGIYLNGLSFNPLTASCKGVLISVLI